MGVSVSIEVNGPARVGERVAATVVVECDAERDVDAITLDLDGSGEVWRGAEAHRLEILTEKRQIAGPTVLTPGVHRYRAKFDLPADLPPSIDAGDLTVTYELRTRVEIPWRFDPTATRTVTVLPPLPSPRGEPRRAVARSTALDGEPFLELTLDDTAWAPGETITGAFSIGNVDAVRLDGATIAVVRLNDGLALSVPGGCSIFKSLVGVTEGSVTRFALPLPDTAAPSFESRIGNVQRAVVLRIDGTSVECAIPIVIDAFEPRAGAVKASGEAVGGARWRSAWSEEGERFGLSLARAELALRGELAGGAVSVTVHPTGNTLAAELRWESLGIGLSVTRRGLLSSGVDLYDTSPAFADRFAARGRDEAQVRAALDADVCAALVAFSEAEMDDDSAKIALDAPARQATSLRRFLEAIDALATAVVAASARLPPPAWVDAKSAAAWRAFAEATAGRLSVGSMQVRGAIIEGDRVHVKTLLDDAGRPKATRVVLVLEPAVQVREPPAMPEELRRVKDYIGTDDKTRSPRRFDVQPNAITVEVGGFTHNPGRVGPLVAEMQRLAARLRGESGRGPYR